MMWNRMSRDKKTFNILGFIYVGFMALLCVFPMYLIVTGSFTDNNLVAQEGFSLWPKLFSLDAYKLVFKNPAEVLNAYRITVTVTVIGTVLLVLMCSMTGYVLSRKDYRIRNGISFYFFFTTLFGGGLVPWYILCVMYLKFKQNPLVALIAPGLFGYFYVIIFRSFVSGIPDSISESARIDGAGDFTIYAKIILPICKPVLATIGLFGALNYWNDWFNCMLFITKRADYNLQYYLYATLNTAAPMQAVMAGANINITPPTHTFKLAMTVVTIGPILLLYPFLQKYFIKGIALGAVKG